MPAVADLTTAFAPPQPYAVGWIIAAALAMLAVLGWLVWLWWWARPRTGDTGPITAHEHARTNATQQLDALLAAHQRGEITARAASEQASAIVREFSAGTTGLPLRTMTLSDLHRAAQQRSDLPPLSGLIAVLYPPEFGPHDADDATPLLHQAREVVTTWP